jgi:hypothetical protein
LSELLRLGAVFNRFRLGEPGVQGLLASPTRESREVKPPLEAIKDEKAEMRATDDR